MEFDEALHLAQTFLNNNIHPPATGDKLVIPLDAVKEESDGWYFPFQTEKFLKNRDLNDSIVGNWPIFVTRDGRVAQRRFGAPFSNTSSS